MDNINSENFPFDDIPTAEEALAYYAVASNIYPPPPPLPTVVDFTGVKRSYAEVEASENSDSGSAGGDERARTNDEKIKKKRHVAIEGIKDTHTREKEGGEQPRPRTNRGRRKGPTSGMTNAEAERYRRERMKQRLDVLQQLVPVDKENPGRIDVLDKVIAYIQKIQQDGIGFSSGQQHGQAENEQTQCSEKQIVKSEGHDNQDAEGTSAFRAVAQRSGAFFNWGACTTTTPPHECLHTPYVVVHKKAEDRFLIGVCGRGRTFLLNDMLHELAKLRLNVLHAEVTTGRDGHIMDAYHVQSVSSAVAPSDEIQRRLQNVLEISPLPQGIESFEDLSLLPENAVMMAPLEPTTPIDFGEPLDDLI